MTDQQLRQSGGSPSDRPEDYGVPQPPEIEKQWTFSTLQKLGVPLLILIPLLALSGLFGESFATTTETGNTFAVEITYPSRYRYNMLSPLTVSIENRSDQVVPTVTVSFGQDYISQFSNVSFTPEPDEVTGEAYYVRFDDLQPGEVRLVQVELQADRYWRHNGSVAVAPGDADDAPDVVIEVSTLVYP